MKNLMIVGIVFLAASAAHAARFNCTTNVHQNPRVVSTSITVASTPTGSVTATLVTMGGMTNFETAPRTITVQSKNFGPEYVEYFNAKEDFDLAVSFQPIGHQIFGTYTGEIQGRRVRVPVICFETVVFQN